MTIYRNRIIKNKIKLKRSYTRLRQHHISDQGLIREKKEKLTHRKRPRKDGSTDLTYVVISQGTLCQGLPDTTRNL
jgi:hypothetical protein